MHRTDLSYYADLKELGRGGMGVVYSARDTRLDRRVALKFLPAHLSADTEARARFTREAKAASGLNHPNICTIHEIGEHDGQTYIAMALYDGETLERQIARGPIDVPTAVDIGIQLVGALSRAHEHGIVHRDVKPANIMITSDGRVVLLDFGLAKVTELTKITKDGSAAGTIAYMSPEQTRGDLVDARTDIWAVGAVLYEMITGNRPFKGLYDQAVVYGILNMDPDPPSVSGSNSPADLAAIIMRCLSKEITHRFQSATELLDALSASTQDSKLHVSTEAPGLVAPDDELGGIAVLPFETLGHDDATPFTQGIHGDILTRLSSLAGLRAISRTSVKKYRNTEKSIQEIGKELSAIWVLEGDVQEAGTQVRVNVRLVDAREDRQIWSEYYQEKLTAENVFSIQSEITKKIVGALKIQLSPSENEQIDAFPTNNLVAYRLAVQGRVFLNERTESGVRRAAETYQLAIDQDENYALAWVGKASALTILYDYGYAKTNETLVVAEEAARKALSLDPNLPEAFATLGLISTARQRGAEARGHFLSAIRLRPGFAEAHNWLSWLQIVLGHTADAVESARLATELDPLSPEAVSNFALSTLIHGDAEKALEIARRDADLNSAWTTGRFYEGLALMHLGHYQDATEILTSLTVEWAGFGPQLAIALAHIADNDSAAALPILAKSDSIGDSYSSGLIRLALGEVDAGFNDLRNHRDWSSWNCLAIRNLFPLVLQPLKNDPQYIEIIRSVDQAWQLFE